jgi:hypothetical protein
MKPFSLHHKTWLSWTYSKGKLISRERSDVPYHLELDADATPLPLNTPAISFNRHFIRHGQRDAFQKRFEDVKPLLQNYTKPRAVAGGWRIEKEAEDKEEWDLFSGFESVEHYIGFSKTDEFQKYRSLVEYVDSFEVKHMKHLEDL